MRQPSQAVEHEGDCGNSQLVAIGQMKPLECRCTFDQSVDCLVGNVDDLDEAHALQFGDIACQFKDAQVGQGPAAYNVNRATIACQDYSQARSTYRSRVHARAIFLTVPSSKLHVNFNVCGINLPNDVSEMEVVQILAKASNVLQSYDTEIATLGQRERPNPRCAFHEIL